jgi:hypothetical protein
MVHPSEPPPLTYCHLITSAVDAAFLKDLQTQVPVFVLWLKLLGVPEHEPGSFRL